MNWKLPVAVLVVGGAVAFVSLNSWAKSIAVDTWSKLTRSVSTPGSAAEPNVAADVSPTRARSPGTTRRPSAPTAWACRTGSPGRWWRGCATAGWPPRLRPPWTTGPP